MGCMDLLSGVHCATQAEIDQHLALGMNLLARGSYSDALSHFHAAVDADPNNYMSYYKRATVYMALSRPRPALADLDKIMQIKPDFLKARQQRGGLLLKMGRLNEVNIDSLTDFTYYDFFRPTSTWRMLCGRSPAMRRHLGCTA